MADAMIVCSCNVLSDRDVRDAAEAPGTHRTVAKIYRSLDCRPDCGRCAGSIRRIIDECISRPFG